MVIGTAAGGGSDLLGRVLAERLGVVLGQRVIVENVGNAVAATARVAHAQPNGYLFELGFASTHAAHPSLYKKPAYDVVNDFTPVALIAEQPFVVVVRNDFPANNLVEFASYAKANQARLQYGSATGIGSLNHLSCELLNSALGIKVTVVPYRDIGPLTQDMMAGRIDYQCPLPGTMIPLIQSNRLKGIAITGKERLSNLPDLATAEEQGLKGFDVETWFAFFMPRGVPDEVVRRLNTATNETMNTPAVQERLQALAVRLVSPERRSPEYLKKFVLDEIDKWSAAVKLAGVSLD
jgi:tripartite-type tricarboxylate transporter receptor subunit TctC